MDAESWRMVAIGLTMAVGVIMPAFAIGWIGSSAMNALGRNPEARGAITTNLVLAIALAEALGIYCLITAVLLVFVV